MLMLLKALSLANIDLLLLLLEIGEFNEPTAGAFRAKGFTDVAASCLPL